MKNMPILFMLNLLIFSSTSEVDFEKKVIHFFSYKTGGEISINQDLKENKIKIDFVVNEKVFNLLVRIGDTEGNTLFLDNQYGFSGQYQREVDTKNWANGIYTVDIVLDNKQASKSIKIDSYK